MRNTTITLSSGESPYAAIDTGTTRTLIDGPASLTPLSCTVQTRQVHTVQQFNYFRGFSCGFTLAGADSFGTETVNKNIRQSQAAMYYCSYV
jgi:hypothetical protein